MHRPRFASKYFQNLSPKEAQEKYKIMSNEVKNYLIEMDIPTRVIDTMFSIGSDNLLFLDDETIESMKNVPFFNEWVNTKCNPITDDELDEYWSLFNRLTYGNLKSKAENFYLDHLHKKKFQYKDCVENIIVENMLKSK